VVAQVTHFSVFILVADHDNKPGASASSSQSCAGGVRHKPVSISLEHETLNALRQTAANIHELLSPVAGLSFDRRP
jgi:hypothetical protein